MNRYAIQVSFSRKPANQRRAREGPGAGRVAAVTLATRRPYSYFLFASIAVCASFWAWSSAALRRLLARQHAVDRVEVGLHELLAARGRRAARSRTSASCDEDLHGVVELRLAERLVDVLVDLGVGHRVRGVEAGERRAGSLARVEALLRGGAPTRSTEVAAFMYAHASSTFFEPFGTTQPLPLNIVIGPPLLVREELRDQVDVRRVVRERRCR